MQELITDQLRDLYDAEKQLTKALPKLAKSAEDEELEQGFREHLEQTKGHVQRLEQVFEQLGMRAKSKPCEAMKGLVKEGQEAIEEDYEGAVGDIALIAAARRVEHYERAAYDTLILALQASKQTEAVGLLQETLREEVETGQEAGDRRQANFEGSRESAAGRGGTREAASIRDPKGASSKASKSEPAKSKASKSKTASGDGESHSSQTTTDHDEIQQWAEARGGKPSCVRGTGGKNDIGLMRIEFPGKPNANDDKLEEITWEEFFERIRRAWIGAGVPGENGQRSGEQLQ